VAGADGVEEDLAAGAVEGHEADLVEDEDIDALEATLVATELAIVARLEKDPHEVGGTPDVSRLLDDAGVTSRGKAIGVEARRALGKLRAPE
jgi:hypothetical protein